MQNSLFIEHHDDGIAFYINGDLQFDTRDEFIYHEYLVIPVLTLATKRFPHTDLQVLICGGGDGLAARDVLRFEQIQKIDLVDYDPQVIELGKTVFNPYNLGSLEQEKVNTYTQEAFEFVSQIPDNSYHVVICDFTYPNSATETKVYSLEWFQEINRILINPGFIATNGVSPEKNTQAFWCLYETLLAANLTAKPLQINIPSFHSLDYGTWGFFLASPQVILRQEIADIYDIVPDNLQAFNQPQLTYAFVFAKQIADHRHNTIINTWRNQQLFYYLLNYQSTQDSLATTSDEYINFLDLDEQLTAAITYTNYLDLETVAKFWLENIYATPDAQTNVPEIEKLLPVRHRYHNPKMTAESLAQLKVLLSEIDIKRLLNTILTRAQELPPKIASELQNLAEAINNNQPITKLTPKAAEFIALLALTILMANLVAPDSVFAKNSSASDSDESGDVKFFGLFLAFMGGTWLVNIFKRYNDD